MTDGPLDFLRCFQVSSETTPSTGTASRKVTVMCVTVAAFFTVTSLPLQIDYYVVSYAEGRTRNVAQNLLIHMRTIMMANACINPVIYGLMWRPFRSSLHKVLF